MKNSRKKILSAILAICCALPCGVVAYAADNEDDWGVIPDGYVFFIPSSQSTVTVDKTPDNGKRTDSISDNKQSEIPEASASDGGQAPSMEGEQDDKCAYTLEEFASVHLKEINRVREENGLAAMETDPVLIEIAQARVEEYQSGHKRPDGSKWSTIFKEYETVLRPVGENWIGPWDDPYAQFQAFMDSDGHRANILKEKIKYVGIGVQWNEEENKVSVIQLFAK